MSLRHALLAVLTAEPMTGYQLVKYFDGTVVFMWSAPHSQIYPELQRMLKGGLLEAEVVPRGRHAEKRIYSISGAGRAELRRWAEETSPYQSERDPHRLKAAYMELASPEAAREQLNAHIRHYRERLGIWERIVEDIDDRRIPLLRQRLRTHPADQYELIVEAKRFAFQGEIDRARMEIDWAGKGLALLDRLHRSAGASGPVAASSAVEGGA
jgi:PadR family transcriptional regulator, regulatory protein AphA